MRVLDVGVLLDGVPRTACHPLGGEQTFHSHRPARVYPPRADAHLPPDSFIQYAVNTGSQAPVNQAAHFSGQSQTDDVEETSASVGAY